MGIIYYDLIINLIYIIHSADTIWTGGQCRHRCIVSTGRGAAWASGRGVTGAATPGARLPVKARGGGGGLLVVNNQMLLL